MSNKYTFKKRESQAPGVTTQASNEKEVFVSAMHKLREFASLGYPVSVRKGACYRVARDGGGLAWLAAAKAQGA